ncbi:hypothetical protein H3C61_00890 [Candidatus Gracilibacteria bacterium]|nr:hypothetical protein [Candidatus Gracilibacteria bacterium]
MTNKLSSEAQVCYNEVKQSPENQRQSTFERACQSIKDKTQIALLAAMLGLGLSQIPNTAQASEPQKIETQANSVTNNSEYKKLLSTLENDFNALYQQGLKEINPSSKKDYDEIMVETKKGLKDLDSMTPDMVSYLVESGVIKKGSPFYINITQYTNQYIPFIKQATAERMANIDKTRQRIAQNRETIARNRRDIATLNALADAFKKK